MGDRKTDIPSDKLILELLQPTPIVLLLDEFQTWFDGLTDTKQYPWRKWAFNFIQLLSEIAKEHPDRLVLVVSVRNGGSDAYQQIHRVNPVSIDFKAGGSPERIRQDRRRMLLHRLFENRRNISDAGQAGHRGQPAADRRGGAKGIRAAAELITHSRKKGAARPSRGAGGGGVTWPQ
jgi:hypothetical protein